MVILYYLFVKIYGLMIILISPFNSKASKWVKGRRNIFKKISDSLHNDKSPKIWIHCSSFGEFEQGKPLIEALRSNFPDNKIIATFFSPSGYEYKKNDKALDYVFYLPLDGPVNSRKFVELIKPVAVFFVKYEFWHFYIRELKHKHIPCYSVSSIFRPSQLYFKWYGKFFKNILQRMSMIFVQDQKSLELLYNASITHVTVSGDRKSTRLNSSHVSESRMPSSA